MDAIKAVMTGAHAVQVVSALLQRGPEHLRAMRDQMAAWLTDHEYTSLEQALGSITFAKNPDPAAFERGNYMQILQSYRF